MTLTVPRAGIIGGAAPSLRFDRNTTGETLAGFGDRMIEIGHQIEQERVQRAQNRARVKMMAGLNDLQTEFDQVGDPDMIDSQYTQRVAALKDSILADLPEAAREQAGLNFDEMAMPHTTRQGRRAIGLRHSTEMAHVMEATDEMVRAAATASAETLAAYRDQFGDNLDDLVLRGIIAPDEAQKIRVQGGARMESARATRMLSDDPQGLVQAIDGGEFVEMGGDDAQGWRAQAVAASAAAEARIEAQRKLERTQQVGTAKDLFRDGISVLGKGQPFAGAEDAVALLSDPEIAALPEAREYIATVDLTQSRPDLGVLPLAQKRALLADLEKQAISKPYEAGKVSALRKMIADDEKGFGEDPISYAPSLGLRSADDLPDPGSATQEELVGGLRQRGRYVGALQQQGYVENPKFFTAAERQVWTEAIGPAASPARKAELAASLAVSLGPSAEDAANELGADPVFGLIGGGLQHGMSPQTARQIFEGQRVIQGQQVKLPAKAERRQSFFGKFDSLFFDGTVAGWPDQSAARDQITAAADALYAYRMRSAQASGDGKEGTITETVYLQSVHEVMGGTGRYNKPDARGGVQELRDALTILPAEISASLVEDRLDELSGASPEVWLSVSASANRPQIGGQAADAHSLRQMRLRAIGPDQYIMVRPTPSGGPAVMMGDDGKTFVLSIRALMQGGQP